MSMLSPLVLRRQAAPALRPLRPSPPTKRLQPTAGSLPRPLPDAFVPDAAGAPAALASGCSPTDGAAATGSCAPAAPPPRLLDRVRHAIRVRHYAIRTESAYVDWAKRFILFHGKRHPVEMGAAEVEAFLTHLAIERHVAASTQNQAKAALLVLYKDVLGVELPWLDEVGSVKDWQRLPVVLTSVEVRAAHEKEGPAGLVASLGGAGAAREGRRIRASRSDGA